MSFQDALKKSFIEGFTANDMPVSQILTILGVTFLIGIYIYVIYKLVNRTAMYDRSYHVAMSVICVITAGIILAMQSSIVISLGMVGALSIVRFRTAVKDTMDLLFLFWSIGEGIICGAGLFELAVIVALMVTAGIFILEFLPFNKKPYLLIVNSEDADSEKEILEAVKNHCNSFKVKSRNLKKTGLDMILEVSTSKESDLLKNLNDISSVENTSLLTHEGEVRI
ncbi:MAG: DUF4956 domain-containing protein [Lachnospiraceae bacterium]|nr:DUF4956 domain-containing protein [Lachnospiraceae bacterium]